MGLKQTQLTGRSWQNFMRPIRCAEWTWGTPGVDLRYTAHFNSDMLGSALSRSVAELLGAPPPAKTGRERIVAAAIELFYLHGFGAVGLDQVIARAGVTKTTFYKHFEGKDDLMVAAVERRDEWESAAWEKAAREIAGDDPAGHLLAYFEIADHWFNNPEFHGCMFLNATIEFPNPHDPVHTAAAKHKRRMRDHFRNLAGAAGAVDAESFADTFTALFEGMLVLRHSHGRNDAARVIRPAVERLLAASIAQLAGKPEKGTEKRRGKGSRLRAVKQ